MSTNDHFLPDQARLAVSFSLMFEAGGQPISGAPGSFGPIEKGRAGSSLISQVRSLLGPNTSRIRRLTAN